MAKLEEHKWNIKWNAGMFMKNSGKEKERIVDGTHAQKTTKRKNQNGWQYSRD